MVWDIGTYEVVEGNYYKGRIVVFINGKKRCVLLFGRNAFGVPRSFSPRAIAVCCRP
jgi:hypothetical protein